MRMTQGASPAAQALIWHVSLTVHYTMGIEGMQDTGQTKHSDARLAIMSDVFDNAKRQSVR